jgi:membrane-associated phospholipid phosphatase
MYKKIALILSNVINPIVVIVVFTAYQCITKFGSVAATSSLTIIFLAMLALVGYILRAVQQGKLTNLDASVQTERQNRLYLPIIAILIVLCVCFYFLRQPVLILHTTLWFLVLFTIGYFVNFFIKASLHVGIPTFVALISLGENSVWPIGLLLLIPLVGWSRYYLQRHTVFEIVIGAMLGASVGFMNYLNPTPTLLKGNGETQRINSQISYKERKFNKMTILY